MQRGPVPAAGRAGEGRPAVATVAEFAGPRGWISYKPTGREAAGLF